jgi:hypothetical protein
METEWNARVVLYIIFFTFGIEKHQMFSVMINPLNAELNPICHFLGIIRSSPYISR